MQPDLLDRGSRRPRRGRARGARVSGAQPASVRKRPQRVVGGHRPAHRAGEPVGAQRVDRGLEQARAVAPAALVGVEGQLGQLAVGDRVAVGVGGRAR